MNFKKKINKKVNYYIYVLASYIFLYKKKINYIFIQIVYIILFIGLFFFAKYKGVLIYLLYRFFLFLIISLFIIIIKIYYYFMCLPFFEEYIQDFFKKYKFINNLCLFILKWTNLIYIYNDLLLIIIKLVSKLRSYKNKLVDKNYKLPYKWCYIYYYIDIFLYFLFFIIIKNLIITFILKINKIKKRFIEADLFIFIKNRIIIWIIMSYIFIYFIYMYNIFYIFFFYLIYILFISYKKIKFEIKLFYFLEHEKHFELNKSNKYFFFSIKKFELYDELKNTHFILRNCNFKEDYNLNKINLLATKKLIDNFIFSELKMYNENFYWYQYDLYFKEKQQSLIFIWINSILNILKFNILSILRINNELYLNTNINCKDQLKLLDLKKKYLINLLIINEFFKVLKNSGMICFLKLCDIIVTGDYYTNYYVEKNIELRFSYDNVNKLYFISHKDLYKYYKLSFKNLRNIIENEDNYLYSKKSNLILKKQIIKILPLDLWASYQEQIKEGFITEEEFIYMEKEYKKKDFYIYNFEYYIKTYIFSVNVSTSINTYGNNTNFNFNSVYDFMRKNYYFKLFKNFKKWKNNEKINNKKMYKFWKESKYDKKKIYDEFYKFKKDKKRLYIKNFY